MSHIIRELVEAVILALLVFFIIQISIQNFRVEGHSMKPNLDGGEYLMVNKITFLKLDMHRLSRLVPFWDAPEAEERYLPFAHPPDRGDVVVFHAPVQPLRDFVKRVIGMPGETVELRSGVTYINGVKLEEPYLPPNNAINSAELVTLEDDEYYVMGDNRSSSHDSRDWGPLTLDRIVGKVWFVYWPLSELPFVGKLADYR